MSRETQKSFIKVHPDLSMSKKLEYVHRGERRGLPFTSKKDLFQLHSIVAEERDTNLRAGPIR